jgi:hypothetical protein
MARHDRKLRMRQFAVHHMQIGAAHAAGFYLDQQFAWPRQGNRTLAQGE